MRAVDPSHGLGELSDVAGRRGFDGTTFLTIYAALLLCIPSQLTIAPLGGAGAPATVVGLVGLLWWTSDRLRRARVDDPGRQPVRIAMALFCASVCAAFVVAMTRPINAEEISTANLGLLLLAAWAGVFLVANDGIPSLDRLHRLLRRLSALGGVIATLGIAQFVTHQAWVDRLEIPGLTANHEIFGALSRQGFTRPAGTSIHPIEFGAVMNLILPIAISYAFADRSRNFVRRWYPVAALAIAIILSVSRSALVGAAVGIAVVLLAWPRRARAVAVGAVLVLVVGVFVTVPGMLGSIAGLFTNIGTDPGTLSRVDSYSIAWEFFTHSPIFGRGFSTFLPSYRIFDNQYLLMLIEGGLAGLVTLVGIVVAGFSAARRSRRAASDEQSRQTGQALAAAVAAGGVSMALFDGFSFPMLPGVLFLVLGCCGALWRLTRLKNRRRSDQPDPWSPPQTTRTD